MILHPSIGVVVWVQYAPPLADSLRKAYRQLLRWNDELPFVKFAVAEDDQPILSAEIAAAYLTRDSLGLDDGPVAGRLRPAVRRVGRVGRSHWASRDRRRRGRGSADWIAMRRNWASW